MKKSNQIPNNDILQFRDELFDLTKRNPLYHCSINKLFIWNGLEKIPHTEATDILKKIHQQSKFIEKENGLSVTLCVDSFIHWKNPKTNEFVLSPLTYRACSIDKIKREEESYSIHVEEEQSWVNPILIILFKQYFNLNIGFEIVEIEKLQQFLQNEFTSIEFVSQINDTDKWQIIQQAAIGNFNYKKLIAVKDYDVIANTRNGLHQVILGNENSTISTSEKSAIFPTHVLDIYQKKAMVEALQSNIVIEGPPGNGKSEFVTALIEQLLLNNKKVLFVSEKRAALDVVYDKLIKNNLTHSLAYLSADKKQKNSFYKELNKTWQTLTHNTEIKSDIELKQSNENLIQFYESIYLKNTADFIEIENELIHQEVLEENTFSVAPSVQDWKKHVEVIQKIEKNSPNQNLNLNVFLKLNASLFKEKNCSTLLHKNIESLKNICTQLNEETEKFKEYKIDALVRITLAASVLQLINSDALFLLDENHKKYKSFSTIAKKYQTIKIKLDRQKKANGNWKNKPTQAEIILLKEELNQQKKSNSILKIIKRNQPKKDYFQGFPKDLSTVSKLQLLQELQQEWRLEDELQELVIKLKFDYHLLHPEKDLDHILQVRSKLKSIDPNAYQTILENSDHVSLIKKLSSLNQPVNRLLGILTYLGINSNQFTLEELTIYLNKIETSLPQLVEQLSIYQLWSNVPQSIRNFVLQNNNTVQFLSNKVFLTHLNHEATIHPEYKNLSGKNLLSHCRKNIREIKLNKKEISKIILQNQYLKIHQLNQLLLKRQTKEELIEQKNSFKQSKRTLMHDLKKSKRHKPIKELVTEIQDLIFSMKPIWIMNPLEVASNLPCINSLFDVVIFDESSQITLADSLPTLYRAKQCVIVGDSQQMPPSNFFQSHSESVSLLDQAILNLQKVILKQHYRSANPSLIHFSNHHFYDGQLKSLPSIDDVNALNLHRVYGVFEENKNKVEAKKVAEQYKRFLAEGKTNVGIIAFSMEQQQEIDRQINTLKLPVNDELIVRNIENIQGHEREHIIISLGYAPNKEGKLNLNFGPINGVNGAKRINVLITRAIKSIDFFTSIDSSSLALSSNEGIAILHDYLFYLENYKATKLTMLPTDLTSKWVKQILDQTKIEYSFYDSATNEFCLTAFVVHHNQNIIIINPGLMVECELKSIVQSIDLRFNDVLIVNTVDLVYEKQNTMKEIEKFITLNN